jgi:hypothetical protein
MQTILFTDRPRVLTRPSVDGTARHRRGAGGSHRADARVSIAELVQSGQGLVQIDGAPGWNTETSKQPQSAGQTAAFSLQPVAVQ